MYKVDHTITCPSGYELVYTNARYGIGAPKQQACAKETNKQEPCPSGYKLYHSDPIQLVFKGKSITIPQCKFKCT